MSQSINTITITKIIATMMIVFILMNFIKLQIQEIIGIPLIEFPRAGGI